jgi:hypothetical protein
MRSLAAPVVAQLPSLVERLVRPPLAVLAAGAGGDEGAAATRADDGVEYSPLAAPAVAARRPAKGRRRGVTG